MVIDSNIHEHMKTKILTIAFLLPILAFGQDQTDFVATNNAKKSLQYAQQFINQNNYDRALKQLRHTLKIKEDFAVAYREMGKVLLELEFFPEGKEAFERSFDLDPKLSRAAYFECGECCFRTDDLSQAQYYYDKYLEMEGKSYANVDKEAGMEITYDLRLRERRANMDYLHSLDRSTYAEVAVINLGAAINSPHDEYLPTITSDGLHLVFTQTDAVEDQNVMQSEKMGGQWEKARPFNNINTENNEGMARFAAHGQAFYFAGCMRADTEGGCDIYEASLDQGRIESISRMDGHLNSQAWDSQPSITCDGQLMFFSSTRRGGMGGADIWFSRRRPNGEWSAAENMGSINTPGDEEAPFISSDGKTLYFTSTGHQGQGDGDLFIVRKEGSRWGRPVNLGYPINSPAKELGIYVQGDGITAYFSSARAGGQGGMDIYQIELPEAFRPDPIVHLEGKVVDEETGAPISTTVRIGRNNQRVEVRSDEDGWFFLCLPGNLAYSFMAQEEGYEHYISAVYLKAQDNATPVKVDVTLLPERAPKPELVSRGPEIKEKRVQFFFGFDSYEINEKTRQDLDQLADFLQKDQQWEVEVVGYADKVGDAAYNQRLSEKRARAIVDYLTEAKVEVLQQVVRREGLGSIEVIDDNSGNKSRRVDVILKRK